MPFFQLAVLIFIGLEFMQQLGIDLGEVRKLFVVLGMAFTIVAMVYAAFGPWPALRRGPGQS